MWWPLFRSRLPSTINGTTATINYDTYLSLVANEEEQTTEHHYHSIYQPQYLNVEDTVEKGASEYRYHSNR